MATTQTYDHAHIPVTQFVGHTFFFGAVLGYLVWRARARARRAPTAV
jgi:hypothetical protein